jgi:hypothetical protein
MNADAIPFARPTDGGVGVAPRDFRAIAEGHYRLTLRGTGLELEVSRLRRERFELCGELVVRCDVAGARTVAGALSTCTFNLSNLGARKNQARHLAERARITGVDFFGILEEFCQLVHDADRRGQPAEVLRDVSPLPDGEHEYDVDGLRFPRLHPTIAFGDAGTVKSLVQLYTLGRLEQQGVRTALFDWELDRYAHRQRLEQLFGPDMPEVRYARCDRPLIHELDRVARIVRDERVAFAGFDSVGFACDGPPEAAESAMAYLRAVRQLSIGTMHVAHIRQGKNNDQRPFGSTFWHAGARCTWNFKVAATSTDRRRVNLGLFNRKSNFGSLRSALGFQIDFDTTRTWIKPGNVADVDELAKSLPVWQRMKHVLDHGPKTLAVMADELAEKVETLDRTVRRKSALFTRIPGTDGITRIALVERRAS